MAKEIRIKKKKDLENYSGEFMVAGQSIQLLPLLIP